jgi:hypothetical protein
MGGFEDLTAMIVAGDERAVAATEALVVEGKPAPTPTGRTRPPRSTGAAA